VYLSLKILWNPWRYEYIKSLSPRESGESECLFCTLQKRSDEEALIIHRGRRAFVVMNAYPYNSGHLMIAPYTHVGDPVLLDQETMIEIFELIRKSITALREAFHPDGFNIGANIGRAAGAGVPDHFHIHVVPRWVGDANFMAIIADTKPLPIALREAFELIRKHWSRG
jgi:ATP adenylyltransferase